MRGDKGMDYVMRVSWGYDGNISVGLGYMPGIMRIYKVLNPL